MDDVPETVSTAPTTTKLTSSTMATSTSGSESKIVYVWVPFSIFLVVVFVILCVSFVRHARRVLRKRRIMHDYMEVNLMYKRSRIVRMYTHKVNTGRPFDLRNMSPWDEPSFSYSGFPVYGFSHYDPKRLSGSSVESFLPPWFRDSQRFLQVPNAGGERTAGGPGASARDGAPSGQSNLVFSFDEDLGRNHLRRVIPPVPNEAGQTEDAKREHGEREPLRNMDAVDLDSESQRVICCSTETSPQHTTNISQEPQSSFPEGITQAPTLSSASFRQHLVYSLAPVSVGSVCNQSGQDSSDAAQSQSSLGGPHRTGFKKKTKTMAMKKNGRPRPKPRSRSDSYTVSNRSETGANILSTHSKRRTDTESFKSGGDRPFSAYTLTKSDSESTATTVMTSSFQSGTTTSSTSGKPRLFGKGRNRVPSIERMVSALEVYTIERNDQAWENSITRCGSMAASNSGRSPDSRYGNSRPI